MEHTSRIPGFYKRPLAERAALVAEWAKLTPAEQSTLLGIGGLNAALADNMIENAVGIYSLPLGIATNFLINGQDYLIPMVVEEPSVLAAVSNAARLFREGGGFVTSSDEPLMIGQMQVLDVEDVYAAAGAVKAQRKRLVDTVNQQIGGSMVERGGGARDLELRPLPETPGGPMLIVHLLYDVRDAMGANAINTTLEALAPLHRRASLAGGSICAS